MGLPRGAAASISLQALLLLGVSAVPASAQPAQRARTAVGTRVAVPPPDLPARLDASLGDVEPGEDADAAISRIVADPRSVLGAYAPLHEKGTTEPVPVVAMPKPAAPTAVRPLSLDVSTADLRATLPLPVVILRPIPAGDALAEAFRSAPAAAAVTPASLDPPSASPSAMAPAAASQPPVAAESSSPAAAAGGLDPSVFGQALQDFVGAAPAPVAGRINAAQAARFRERTDIAAVYAARGNAPFWIENARFSARARAVLSRIDHAAEDGLDLKPYPVAAPTSASTPADLAAAELSLTQAAVAYGRQATGGRMNPAAIGPLVAAKPDVADAARVLDALASASDAGDALRAFNPAHKGYLALRDKLAELRRKSEVAGPSIPYGPTLKPGMRDARVPLVRARFGIDATQDTPDGLVYDTRVAAAVADFQRAHHMTPSGALTARTIAVLSGGDPRRLEGEIIANMERWRWLPRDLGENRLVVNIPDFSLDVLHGDAVAHHTRVVVGQPDKPTPMFSETMRFIIVNPYWNVPLSIVKNEMLPRLAANPNYFASHGYEVVERNGVTYVRQPPGESNALGRIKFMFPNAYSVYLHDTNARALFGKSFRALSHGCVRVEQPFKLAEAVLGPENGWPEARVKKMIGRGERTINLPTPLPIHIVYFTAFVDAAGELQLRDDVYGYSAKVRAALGLAS